MNYKSYYFGEYAWFFWGQKEYVRGDNRFTGLLYDRYCLSNTNCYFLKDDFLPLCVNSEIGGDCIFNRMPKKFKRYIKSNQWLLDLNVKTDWFLI